MRKINILFKSLLLALTLVATSCNKDLQDDVNDLKNRVTTLEESVAELQDAIASGKLITAVDPILATDTTPNGWKITFSDNTIIKVYDGKPGLTPWVWVNNVGNWAQNMGTMPTDSNDAKYEIKVNGQSIKAQGLSMRAENVNGYIGFQQYDAVTGAKIGEPVVTNFPYDSGKIITSIAQTEESYTFTIDGVDYVVARPIVLPTSITVIRDRDYVVKGGSASFNIAVNPSTNKIYPKEDFELDFEPDYLNTRVLPEFLTLKDVVADEDIKGQYRVTIEWTQDFMDATGKPIIDAPIFIILNMTDAKGNPAQVLSSTPVLMNEEYKIIKNENVIDIKNIVMFTDETYTSSVLLSNYHKGYVKSVDFNIAPSVTDMPHLAVNPFTRYTPEDMYKFTVVPIPGDNATIWPAGVMKRVVDAQGKVTDTGKAAIAPIPEDPTIGRPAQPGVSKIDPTTITKNFTVTVYKVPANGIIYEHDFSEYWLPNKTINHRPSTTLQNRFAAAGYSADAWDFVITGHALTSNPSTVIPMDKSFIADATKFDLTNNFAITYAIEPTIQVGEYTIVMSVEATPKTLREGIETQKRTFKVAFKIKIVSPSFKIDILDHSKFTGTTLVANDTYRTYNLAELKITDLIDVESTQNISKAADIITGALPLGYDFNIVEPRHGAQGVRFTPYPVIAAPTVAEWGVNPFVRRSIVIIVKLDTGQEIPVQVLCKNLLPDSHGKKNIFVQYDRLNLDHVAATIKEFKGNYNAMLAVGIDITQNNNYLPHATPHVLLHPTMIQSIVYSDMGPVECANGDVPNGIIGKKILTVDPKTGIVKSIDGVTWENPDAILFQTFKVTYTDIWGNVRSNAEVQVFVKSNGVPN